MIDYDGIKALARTMSVSIEDLLALHQNNDPFYADAQFRRAAAEWFTDQAKVFGFGLRYHIRRAHYTLANAATPVVKPDGRVYQNTKNDWTWLVNASRDARYLELISLTALVDHRNPEPLVYSGLGQFPPVKVLIGEGSLWQVDLPEELDLPTMWLANFVAEQKYLIEIWTEKSGQNDVLHPLARSYRANLVNFDGESSEIGCRDAVRRSIEHRRPLRVLYLSDFDPGGRSMPLSAARKIEYWLRSKHPDLDVTVDPIALLPEQVAHYRLPGIPMKEGESRAGKFRADFGVEATELDALEALHPGELRKIVERAILRHHDTTLRSRVAAAREEIDEQIEEAEAEVAGRFKERADDARAAYADVVQRVGEFQDSLHELWSEYRRALRNAAPSVAGVRLPQAHDEDDQLAPLFDSKRDYMTQLEFYRRWQRRGPNGAAR